MKVLILVVSPTLAMAVIYYLREVLSPFAVVLTFASLLDPVVQGLAPLRLCRSADDRGQGSFLAQCARLLPDALTEPSSLEDSQNLL